MHPEVPGGSDRYRPEGAKPGPLGESRAGLRRHYGCCLHREVRQTSCTSLQRHSGLRGKLSVGSCFYRCMLSSDLFDVLAYKLTYQSTLASNGGKSRAFDPRVFVHI